MRHGREGVFIGAVVADGQDEIGVLAGQPAGGGRAFVDARF